MIDFQLYIIPTPIFTTNVPSFPLATPSTPAGHYDTMTFNLQVSSLSSPLFLSVVELGVQDTQTFPQPKFCQLHSHGTIQLIPLTSHCLQIGSQIPLVFHLTGKLHQDGVSPHQKAHCLIASPFWCWQPLMFTAQIRGVQVSLAYSPLFRKKIIQRLLRTSTFF